MEAEQHEEGTSFFKTKTGLAVIAAGVVIVAGAAFFAFSGGDEDSRATPRPVATAALNTSSGVTAAPTATSSASPPAAGSDTGSEGGSSSGTGEATGDSEGGEAPAGKPAGAPASQGPIKISDHQQAPEVGDWQEPVDGFAKAWANPSVGKDAWLAAMKPFITPGMYQSYTYTDISQVPQLEVEYVTIHDESPRTRTIKIVYKDGTKMLAQAEIQNDGSFLVNKSAPLE